MAIQFYANFALSDAGYDIDHYTLNIPGPNILHIFDVFDQTTIDRLLDIFPNTECIVSDHVVAHENHYNFHGRDFVGIPLWVSDNVNTSLVPATSPISELQTTACATFMVNKKQVNRFLCIKLVEWFDLKCNYSWSGGDFNFDLSGIIDELDNQISTPLLDQDCRGFLLSPIVTAPKIITLTNDNDLVVDKSSGCLRNYGGSGRPWAAGLEQQFLTSAISLITETVQYQKLTIFTEKTMYSVLGCTFPIWVGGYNQPSEWAKLGFDIFDDLIDHSYQNYPTLIERCYYAFKNNLNVLTNYEHVCKLRELHYARLLANRELLLNNKLHSSIVDKISSLPAKYADPLATLVDCVIKNQFPNNI